MSRKSFALIILGALLSGGLLSSPLRGEPIGKKPTVVLPSQSGLKVQVEDLHPFTRVAYLPPGSDVETIRFEKAKTVKVPTKITYTTDTNYCEQVMMFEEPGGSMECPRTETGSLKLAYEITFSFRGQALASDEYGLRYFLFQVYFRPDELGPEVRSALSDRKLNRAQAAGYLSVKTYRESLNQVVIDEQRSKFCAGTLLDGIWTRTDPACRDRINYKTVTTPSDYITVRVDPVPTR